MRAFPVSRIAPFVDLLDGWNAIPGSTASSPNRLLPCAPATLFKPAVALAAVFEAGSVAVGVDEVWRSWSPEI